MTRIFLPMANDARPPVRRGPMTVLGAPGPAMGSGSPRGSTFYKRLRRCPREHALAKDALLAPARDDNALTTGILFHAGLEAYYSALRDGAGKVDAERACWDVLRPVMTEPGYGGLPGDDADTWPTVERCLASYFDRWRDVDRWRVIAVEETIGLRWDGLEYSARIDLMIEDLADGGFWIVEHKCLAGETIIETSRGGVPVHTLLDAPSLEVAAYDRSDGSFRWAPATVVPNGVKEIWRLTADDGTVLRATDNHPVYTPRGWVPLAELRRGDWIAKPAKLERVQAQGADWTDPDLAALVGAFIGDGHLSKAAARFTQAPGPMLMYVWSQLRDRGWLGSPHTDDRNGVVTLPASVEFRYILDRLGLSGCRAAEKFVPRELLNASQRVAGFLLGALWSTDGCIQQYAETREGKTQQKVHMVYTSRSEQLARDVQELLHRFGLQSTCRRTSVAYKGERRAVWQTKIVGRASKRAFIDLILVGAHGVGGVFAPKYELAALRRMREAVKEGDDRPIPLTADFAAELCEAGVRVRPERGQSALEAWRIPEQVKVPDPNLRWVQVESVFVDGREMTYAVNVPGLASHVTNGLVTHNTAKAIGADLLEGYQLDMQTLGQVWLARRCLDLTKLPPFRGLVVNITSKHVKPQHQRVLVCPSDAHLRAWERSMSDWTKLASLMRELDYPQALGTCTGPDRGYRRCSYFELCHGWPEASVDDWKGWEPPEGFVRVDATRADQDDWTAEVSS